MSRNIKKNELIRMIGGQNFSSLEHQKSYAPSVYPGGYAMPPSQPGMPSVQPGYQGYAGYPPRPNYPPHY
jgi:hypothetical protein